VLKPRATRDPLEDPSSFQDALAEWFRIHGKDYPWRRTVDPYEVLVSEVMLQQTQIATVLGRGFYTRFLERFPDAASLAEAEDEPLLKAWEGLGYYRRARMLRETARAVVKTADFPQTLEGLQALPGVGRYTANALLAFAYDLPAAVVDGNVARVLSRILDFREEVDAPAGLKKLWVWAEQLADPNRSRVYNSVLMELGQTVCRTGVPDCLNCPVSSFCRTREPELLPRKVAKRKTERIDTHVLWAVDSEGRILLSQGKGKRREGLWMLPARAETQITNYPKVATHTYGITRYHVTMHIYESGPVEAQEDEAWHEVDQIAELAMASPYRKAVEALIVEG
jgi:A/G-specific adenine glycosylase